ncbi:hypothetical protein DCCM_4239 [Desulfocucumis palustris]|uniref:Uncharacterized protein n=1 Tax=Desulfocucumis palustris TaxID=1898651 RepID=A0A2L2XLE6_9FIRM|nr:hypothetical protein DCCM_4239 [Desulfocucumis palustris]
MVITVNDLFNILFFDLGKINSGFFYRKWRKAYVPQYFQKTFIHETQA